MKTVIVGICFFVYGYGIILAFSVMLKRTLLFKLKTLFKMKKLLAILPLLLLSCSKKEKVTENITNNDSVIVSQPTDIDNKMDSAANGAISIDENEALKESFKSDRVVDGNTIIKTIEANELPMTISDEFTTSGQQLVIKIKSFNGNNIIGKITPENPEMNIRFNQIKLANGDYDGPFARAFNYTIKNKGEIWLIIGKSNMASGATTGKFTINLE